jgi:hypothetical protein
VAGHPGGSLRLVRDGVVSSGVVLPVSVAIHGDLVYVADSATGGSNYTGFRLAANGRLRPGIAAAQRDRPQSGVWVAVEYRPGAFWTVWYSLRLGWLHAGRAEDRARARQP